MGPRSADRGNAAESSRELRVRQRLQWGRDQLIAEMRDTAMLYMLSIGLQWGRDQLIAEMTATGCRAASEDAVLQWGRDQLIAEMSR